MSPQASFSVPTLSLPKQLPAVREVGISPLALALFRLIERLSRRTGYACVKLLETLAGMLEKSVRTTRYAISELVAAGWIGRTQTRKGGVSKLFFWPLVRVAGKSRGLFAKPVSGKNSPVSGDFSAPSVAVYSAAYSPSKLPLTPSAPYKKTPVGKRDDNTQASETETLEQAQKADVAVSLLENLVSKAEACELAREAKKQGLTAEQIHRVIAAYRAQREKIRNRGAWLREAIRRGFQPPATTPEHPSDRGERVYPVVKAPKDFAFAPTSENVKPGKESSSATQESSGGGYEAAIARLPFALKRQR